MKYQLTTIKDIFDKVPADRIKTCMDELAVAMQQVKEMSALLEFGLAEVSGQKVEDIVQWGTDYASRKVTDKIRSLGVYQDLGKFIAPFNKF